MLGVCHCTDILDDVIWHLKAKFLCLQVNGQLQKSRAELLRKGKERNQKRMRLSKLQQRAQDLAMCENVS